MDPLGIGIVGTGNIAGGYARDIPTHPSIRLVAATDLDPERRAAFGEARKKSGEEKPCRSLSAGELRLHQGHCAAGHRYQCL